MSPIQPAMTFSGIATIAVAFLVLGCSGPSEPVVRTFRDHVARGPQTFVMYAAEEQRGEWIIMHQCEGARTQDRTRARFELGPDGSARREVWRETLVDGMVTRSSHLQSTGHWEIPSGGNLLFTLKLEQGPEFQVPAQIRSSTTFSIRGSMGGVCAGVPNDRLAEFFYAMQ